MLRSPAFRCLHLFALLAATVAVGLGLLDSVTRPPPVAVPASSSRPAHAGSGRVFIFLVDSLRYETAMDPSMMPNLARLREQATWARMLPTHDAVTVPALRAAFTGEDRFTVFSFAENLWHHEARDRSVFTQLAAAGLATCVWSDGSFKQFSRDLAEEHRVPRGPVGLETGQNRGVLAGLEAFLSGRCETVVAHVNYSDRVAHKVGIHDPEYRRVYAVVDEMIARLDEALGPEHTFVVMGDHGHDERGHHVMGLDVPTLALYRGTGFARGLDLGTIPIRDTRFLVSWALKVPLPPAYAGGRHPKALIAAGDLPADLAEPFDALAAQAEMGAGVPPQRRGAYLTALAAVCAMIGAWFRVALGPRGLGWPALLSWGALVGAVLSGWALAGGALALAAILWPTARRAVTWGAVAMGAALVLAAWGAALLLARGTVHYPQYELLVAVWAAVAIAGAFCARRFGAMRTTWALLLVAGGLLYPTVYRYGAPATMVPVWVCCLAFATVEDARITPKRLLLLGAIWALLVPFAVVNSVQFQFETWVPELHAVLWGARGAKHPAWPGLALALAAKLVFLVPWRAGTASRLTGAAVALTVAVVETGWLGTAGRLIALVTAVTLAGLAVALRFRAARSDRGPLVRVLVVGALLLVYVYSVRIPPASYLWTDCLLAALVLSARYLGDHVVIRDQGGVYPFLLVMAVLVTGWTGMAWGFGRFEWGFLYDVFDAGFVEEQAALFVVPIAGRYLLPLVVARLLLAECLGKRHAYPRAAAMLLAGGKTLSLLLITWGMSYTLVSSHIFVEAMSQTALWAALSLVLFWPGWSARRS